ncbi:MAG: YqgE/AlgH family protein [Candidatus Sulfotelmatobacter sp.]
MALRKLCFYTMLSAILALAVAGRLAREGKEFDVPEANAGRNNPSFAASIRLKREMLPADFFPVQSKNAKSLGIGKLLVASRNLGDPQFAKTVILLARYDAQGVLGLILNRRTDVPLSRVLESPKAAKDRSDPVYLGGPLEMPAVFALFQSPATLEGAEHVFDSVYLITAKPLFEQTISARPDPGVFHVYLGYAGWTQDQLRQEVGLGAWFIFPANASTVFNANPDALWLEMIRKTELQLALDPGKSGSYRSMSAMGIFRQ